MSESREPAIKFSSGGAFHRAVETRVRELTGDLRLMHRAYLVLWAKAAMVLTWALASYVVLVFVDTSAPVVIAASLSLGVASAGIGFMIMHDANHHAFARGRSDTTMFSARCAMLNQVRWRKAQLAPELELWPSDSKAVSVRRRDGFRRTWADTR